MGVGPRTKTERESLEGPHGSRCSGHVSSDSAAADEPNVVVRGVRAVLECHGTSSACTQVSHEPVLLEDAKRSACDGIDNDEDS